MRKIICIALLAILLISTIPGVFAEKPELTQDKGGNLVVANDKKLERLQVKGERFKELVQKKLAKLEEFKNLKKAPAFRKFQVESFKARKIAQAELQSAKTLYKGAKERFEWAKTKYKEVKDDIKRLREELKGLKGNEYKSKEKQIKRSAGNFLEKISEIVTNHLQKLEAKVKGSETLTEEEATALLEKINDAKAKVEEIKLKIDELNEESTKEEIKALAKELKEAWKGVKVTVKESVGKLMNSRIGGIIVRSKHLEAKLTKLLERMAEKEKDTSVVEPLIEEFNSKLSEAKENYEQALESFKTSVQEGHSYMKKAHTSLKEANIVLRKIFFELKKQNVEKDLEDIEVDEDEEPEETEDEEE